MDAIEEAISVARENKDNSTLTYILSWLFNFMKNKPELWKIDKYFIIIIIITIIIMNLNY